MQVKQALWRGGIQRSNKDQVSSNTPGLHGWNDLVCFLFSHEADARLYTHVLRTPACTNPVNSKNEYYTAADT